MPWGDTYNSLRDLGGAFSQQVQQRQQQDMAMAMAQQELQQKFAMEMALANYKAQAEQQNDPFYALKKQIAEQRIAGMNAQEQPSQGGNPFIPQQAMMSLKSGGMGDINAQPIKQNFTQQLTKNTGKFGKFQAPEGYMDNPNFGFGSNDIFVKDDSIKEGRENRLIKQQSFANSTKLRQEFINRPEVKDYIIVSTNVKAMDSLLKKSRSGDIKNNVALDQGLITMYNKLTDPQSVVRESEYARTPGNLPFVNQFQGAFQKLQQGGAGLTLKDREALVQGAKIIVNERGGQYQTSLNDYKGLAAEYGLDEKLITRDMKDYKPYETSSSMGQGGGMPSIQDIQKAKSQGFTRYNTDTGEWLK